MSVSEGLSEEHITLPLQPQRQSWVAGPDPTRGHTHLRSGPLREGCLAPSVRGRSDHVTITEGHATQIQGPGHRPEAGSSMMKDEPGGKKHPGGGGG